MRSPTAEGLAAQSIASMWSKGQARLWNVVRIALYTQERLSQGLLPRCVGHLNRDNTRVICVMQAARSARTRKASGRCEWIDTDCQKTGMSSVSLTHLCAATSKESGPHKPPQTFRPMPQHLTAWQSSGSNLAARGSQKAEAHTGLGTKSEQ